MAAAISLRDTEAIETANDWHALTTEEALARVDVKDTRVGLTDRDVLARREQYGDNALAEAETRSVWLIVAGHVFNVLTLILMAVFVIAVVNEEWIEAVVVVLVIAVNSSIGAYQEVKSEAALAAIRHLGSASNARVVRNGRPTEVPVEEIVIGDIVELRQGMSVPADIRLLEATHLEIDEAALTGESVPVQKVTHHITTECNEPTLSAPPSPSSRRSIGSRPEDLAVGDRVNLAFRQTNVTQGDGRGVVVAVGSASQIGKIASRLAKKSESSGGDMAVTQTMERLMYLLFVTGIVFAVLIFWAFDFDITDSALLYASATLVAILPEAAIVLITVTMAISTRRMAAQNAIVRKITALEQLGRVTDICSDKTGTLTQGKMRPSRLLIYSNGGVDGEGEAAAHLSVAGPPMSCFGSFELVDDPVGAPPDAPVSNEEVDLVDLNLDDQLLDAMLVCGLCSSTRLEVGRDHTTLKAPGGGNPTEIALQELAHKVSHSLPGMRRAVWGATLPPARCASTRSLRSLRSTRSNATTGSASHYAPAKWQPRGEWIFDSAVKMMSTGWYNPETGKSLSLTKGAPERVLPRCVGLNAQARARIAATVRQLATKGLRVLALTLRRDLDLCTVGIVDMERADVERELCLVGLVAVRDPPKEESAGAVADCARAGITVRMLTGDHPDTAIAIAREIGILPPTSTAQANYPRGMVTTGPQLDAMTEAELDAMPELPLLVARSSPTSKVVMVEALHRRHAVVAMTGDGVNDSPAIKEADVGIAMGIAGSDVTKGVADIVLADDNFSTIVAAIAEGRRIFISIQHFVMHLLSGNMAEAVVLLVSLAFVVDDEDLPVFVLSPLAILYLNTATGSGPAIGLALDVAPPDLMTRPPVRHGIFTHEVIVDCLVYGTLMGVFTLASFSLYLWTEGDGELGVGCNKSSGENCESVLIARGTSFLALNTLLLVHAYNCRHSRLSMFKFSFLSNKVLLWSVVIGTLVTIPWLYIPWLNDEVFKHDGVDWEWGLVIGLAIVFLAITEAYKALKRHLLGTNAAAVPHKDAWDTNVAILEDGEASTNDQFWDVAQPPKNKPSSSKTFVVGANGASPPEPQSTEV
eukprot:m.478511 g.478511  ORF g.478511 m.478511 type:complete len:1097 (+) comp21155_c0_seq1:2644-5934(+)